MVNMKVAHEAMIPMMESEKAECMFPAVTVLPKWDTFHDNAGFDKSSFCLRPQQVDNSREVIERLGVIVMNPRRDRISGHASSTQAGGTRQPNGLSRSVGSSPMYTSQSCSALPLTKRRRTRPE
jgi:hypothetical protein